MLNRPLFFTGCVYLVMAAVSFLSPEIAVITSVALLLILLWNMIRRKEWKALLFSVMAAILACGSVLVWQQKADVQLQYAGETIKAEGMITDCQIYDSSLCYDVEIPLENQTMKMKVWSYEMEPIHAGNQFSAVLALDAEEQRYWSDGTILNAQVESMTDLGMASGLRAECLRLRSQIQQRIETLFHGKGQELVLGILLGEKADLSEEVETVFMKSGAIHLLTVSGFHFSMMAGALFAFFGLLQLNPKYCAAFSFPFLLVLLLLEGSTVSVQRAAVMTTLAFLAKILERDYDGLSAWGTALFLVLIPEPIRMFSKSFILSFSAVLGILLFAPILRRELMKILPLAKQGSLGDRVEKRCIEITAISLSANVLTVPFLLYFFGSLSLAAPLSSLLIFPLLPPIMLLAVSAILMPIPTLAVFLAKATQLAGGLLYRALSVIASWNLVYYGENHLLFSGLLLCYLLWLLLYLLAVKRKRVLLCTAIYALALSCCLLLNSAFATDKIQIYCCRSSLLMCRENSAVLVGSIEREKDLDEIRRILRCEQIENLDLLSITANDDVNEIYLADFVEEWSPRYIVSADEVAVFDLMGIEYSSSAAETVQFWKDWSVSFTKNGALLCGNERKFLKLHKKYDIMTMYHPDYTAVLGDDSMIYGDSSISWSRTWGGTLTFSLEVSNDSGTGKPASGANQRG